MNSPKRLNARGRSIRYPELVERDTERCNLCYGTGYYWKGPRQLEIHKIVPAKGYGDLSNLCLAHKKCHDALHTRGKGRFHPSRTKTFDELTPQRASSMELQKHINAFQPFCAWLIAEVGKSEVFADRKLLNKAAWKFTVVQQTIQRYLDVITSEEGPLMIDETRQPPQVLFRQNNDDDASETDDADSAIPREHFTGS